MRPLVERYGQPALSLLKHELGREIEVQDALTTINEDAMDHLSALVGHSQRPSTRGADEVTRSQLVTLAIVFEIIETSAALLVALQGGYEVDPGTVKTLRAMIGMQRQHLAKYMRLPQDPDLPDANRSLGGKLDWALLGACDALESALTLVDWPAKVAARRRMRDQFEERRAARVARHQEIQQEQEAIATAFADLPVERSKRPKREPQPLCEKCGKRPQTSGALCGPCARWEASR